MTAKTIYITPDEYDIAESNGIPKGRVYHRVNTNNWSIERAITEPVSASTMYADEYRKFAAELERTNIVTYETYRKRRRKGITPEIAIKKPEPPKISEEDRKRAAANGISEGTLEARIYNYHWDIERAVTDPVKIQFRSKRKGLVINE